MSCGSPPPLGSDVAPHTETSAPPQYEIVFIIHGDGSYLYHDTDGNSRRADEEALAGAMMVAETNSQAEVFVFHEKRRRSFLLFFPRRDGEFYYYRNGRLLAKESYWRDHGQARFDPEIDLYHRFRVEEQTRPVRLFLYFGHEIPEHDGKGYDASYKERSYTVQYLADGLERISTDSTKFDLVVLSTCFNGTPYTISKLSPFTRYVIASPGNLHLSYLALRPFEALDIGVHDRNISAFAMDCAKKSFDRLARDIQTEISVAVYDVELVQDYLRSVDSVYSHDLTASAEVYTTVEHCDCADDSAYVRPAMSEGVELFYRPARFGRSASKQSHSGWGCIRRSK